MTESEPKVLVGCPTFAGHEKWLKPFLSQHQKYDILLIDNTVKEFEPRAQEFNKTLHTLASASTYQKPGTLTVERLLWDPRKQWYIYMLADCWNRCLEYATENDYDYYLWTATDIFLDQNGGSVQELIDTGLDVVAYPTNVYRQDGPPSVYKTEWQIWNEKFNKFLLDHMTWDELAEIKKSDEPIRKVHGAIGYTLISRKVFSDKRIRFDYPKDGDHTFGEDLIFLQKLKEHQYDYFVDSRHRAKNYTEPTLYMGKLRQVYKEVHGEELNARENKIVNG